jgi:hypothetical protein
MADVSSGLGRSEILKQARDLLAQDRFFDGLSDDTLANYIVEYAPGEIPVELRLRLRDLDVIEALRALPEHED